MHGLAHGVLSDPFGARLCTRLVTGGWCPHRQDGTHCAAASRCCRQPPLPALPAWRRARQPLSTLQSRSLTARWRHMESPRARASWLGGGVWEAPEPGKHLVLCCCDWSYLRVPCRIPGLSQPHNTLRAGGHGHPVMPKHSPVPPGATAAACSWAHRAMMPMSRMPVIFMAVPASAG